MIKIIFSYLLILILLLSGCGEISKAILPAQDNSDNNNYQEPGTVEPSETAAFLNALRSYTSIIAEQNQNNGELVSEEPFEIERLSSSFSAKGVNDGYSYWKYETRTRVINGITETVQQQYCYYRNGQRLDQFYTGGPFDYIERYLDITSSQYTIRFHEKITYHTAQNTTIETFPGSTYSNAIVFNNLTMEVPVRTINYNSGTGNGSGTMQVNWSNMSGSLAIQINANVFSTEGYLNKSNKKAVFFKIADNNRSEMTFLVNKTNSAEYYYTDFNLLNADLVSGTEIKILDSASYTTQLIMNSLSNITLNATDDTTPWLKAETSTILQISNCSNIAISGLSFENGRNGTGYYYLRADNSSNLKITNCAFQKTSNKTSTFLRLATITSSSVENCTFNYTRANRKNIGLQLYTAGIDNNIVFTDNTFTGLQYGIQLNVGSVSNPAVTIANSLFQNNSYGIYRTNTSYQFNNIGNTFTNSPIR